MRVVSRQDAPSIASITKLTMATFVFVVGMAIAHASTLALMLGGVDRLGEGQTDAYRFDQTKQITPDDLCPPPVLDRLESHPVQEGETIDSIATQYGLLPATLIGFNPSLMNRSASPGTTLVIPPYNGIRVNASDGISWQDLSERYNVRADVLFEANGCAEVPPVVFIPGINWSPAGETVALPGQTQELTGYPLSAIAPILRLYGWQLEPGQTALEFHSGIDLDAPVGASVLSVGNGTVAFVGEQGSYGNLVVINHQQGLQTRYAQLATISVTQGETVQTGQEIGSAGDTGNATTPHLHFEVRANSDLGWVAQDPTQYLEQLQVLE